MQSLNAFFESYARALEMYNTKGLAYMYYIPCTLVSDEATTMFNDAGKLEGFFNQGAAFYRQFGITHVVHQLWTHRMVTERIATARVNWQFYDALKQPMYNCDYQYTLKLDKNDQWRILLSISENERQRMEKWQGLSVNEKQTKSPDIVIR